MMLSIARLTLPTLLKITSLVLIGCTLGCSLFQAPDNPQERLLKQGPQQKIYFAKYESVWRAVHQVLKYPIASENQDSGLIETEYVKMVDGFLHPETNKPSTQGTRYKYVIKLIKGKVNGRTSVRVVIEKQIEFLKNFFSEPERLPSDGLEEATLFYRIERELVISDGLEKAQKAN